MQTIEKILSFKGLVVLRIFEFGYESDFRLLPMSAAEFENWWVSCETFEDNPAEAEETLKLLAEVFNEPWQPRKVWQFEWPGESVEVESEEERVLWDTLRDTQNHYFCHVFSDADSFLITPSGKKLLHKGHATLEKQVLHQQKKRK